MTAEPIPEPTVPDPTTPAEPTTPVEPGPTTPAAEAEPTTPAAEAEPTIAAEAKPTTPEVPEGAQSPVASDGAPADPEPDAVAEVKPEAETVAPDSAVVADGPAVVADVPVVVVAAPATKASPRRSLAIAALRRLLAFVLTVALFIGGIAVGVQIFQVTHPPKAAAVGGDVPGAAEVPPVAKEFITALSANDADGLRSSLDVQPHADLTSEFKRFDIQKVTGVETLGTSVDGTRSATEILVRSVKTDGLPFDVNLVILVNNGKIEGFR